jgi:hypothetical protein
MTQPPCMSVVCVSATVHTPARREVPGGRAGSDNWVQIYGVDRGMVTLIRVCERGMRYTSRACREHENEAS